MRNRATVECCVSIDRCTGVRWEKTPRGRASTALRLYDGDHEEGEHVLTLWAREDQIADLGRFALPHLWEAAWAVWRGAETMEMPGHAVIPIKALEQLGQALNVLVSLEDPDEAA